MNNIFQSVNETPEQIQKSIEELPIEKRTYDVYLSAVRRYGELLKIVPHYFKTFAMCKAAIEESAYALQYIPKNTRHLEQYYTIAIRSGGHSLKYIPIKSRTKELCLLAFKENPFSIKYIPKQFLTEEMCLKAFQIKDSNGTFLKHIPIGLRTVKVCVDAMGYYDSDETVQYIPNYLKERVLQELSPPKVPIEKAKTIVHGVSYKDVLRRE